MARTTRSVLVAVAALALVPACSSGPQVSHPGTVHAPGVPVVDGTAAPSDAPAAGSDVAGPGSAIGGAASAAPTPTFLRAVADTTEASDSLRFEIHMVVRMSLLGTEIEVDPDTPYATGAMAGGATRTVVDLGSLMSAMAEQIPGAETAELGGDLSMETIRTADALFLRMPFVSRLASLDPSAAGQLGPLAELGDRWGRVDLAVVTDAFAASDVLAGLGGGQGADPMQLNALLRAVEGEVVEVGRTELRGVPVTHHVGEVSVDALMAAQGLTAEDLEGLGAGSAGQAELLAELLAARLPIEVFVDDEGRLRRVVYGLDLGQLLREAITAAGEDPGELELAYSITLDVFDYGAPDIVVDLPGPASTVDVTGWMLDALG